MLSGNIEISATTATGESAARLLEARLGISRIVGEGSKVTPGRGLTVELLLVQK